MGILHHQSKRGSESSRQSLFTVGKLRLREASQQERTMLRLMPLGCPEITHLVEGAVGPPALSLHHHVGMQEVGCDHVGHKGCVLILEDHSDDVIPDVSLPLQLSTGPQAFTTQPERGPLGTVRMPAGVWGGRQRAHLRICFPRKRW